MHDTRVGDGAYEEEQRVVKGAGWEYWWARRETGGLNAKWAVVGEYFGGVQWCVKVRGWGRGFSSWAALPESEWLVAEG